MRARQGFRWVTCAATDWHQRAPTALCTALSGFPARVAGGRLRVRRDRASAPATSGAASADTLERLAHVALRFGCATRRITTIAAHGQPHQRHMLRAHPFRAHHQVDHTPTCALAMSARDLPFCEPVAVLSERAAGGGRFQSKHARWGVVSRCMHPGSTTLPQAFLPRLSRFASPFGTGSRSI